MQKTRQHSTRQFSALAILLCINILLLQGCASSSSGSTNPTPLAISTTSLPSGQVGAAYRGSAKGMRNGTIVVEGSAGLEVGMRMRRGIIVVQGQVRDFAGLQMKGGTIFLLKGAV